MTAPAEARMDPAHYAYRVSRSAEDGKYVASCLELPSISWLAGSPADARSPGRSRLLLRR